MGYSDYFCGSVSRDNKKRTLRVLLVMSFFASGCSFQFSVTSDTVSETPATETPTQYVSEEPIDWGEFSDEDFLKVGTDGKVRKDLGNGEEISLRGINAGGYLVIERWMCPFNRLSSGATTDHLSITNSWTERFGKEGCLELWESYRENYWGEQDFDNIDAMNMNVIRLPFTYMSVDPAYNNVPEKAGQKYNFDILDDFIERAAQYGLYVILDCHGAYGSQNGQDHSGQIFSSADQVDFYSNEENKKKTEDMWAALAEHYKDIPMVAGYDILNEPGEKAGSTTKKHWDYFDELYQVIREKDENHIVIFESCWDGVNLPQPSVYHWSNCMYSFHNYSGESDADVNLASMQNKIDGVNEQNFGVPYYMGEFNCYDTERSWTSTLKLFNDSGWHWTDWTYKINRDNDWQYSGWGIYYTYAERVNPDTDDMETIQSKFEKLSTDSEDTSLMTFDSGLTLNQMMKIYCQQ